MADRRLALATVTSDSFVPGTLVLVHSFLRHNRWFKGDVILIHDELSERSRRYLSLACAGVRFVSVSAALRGRVTGLVAQREELRPVQERFLSIDAFALGDYDRVLFCDSDILARQSVEPLFDLPHAFIACGDGSHYLNEVFDGPEQGVFFDPARTFNTGMFLIGQPHLTGRDHAALVARLAPASFVNAPSGRTDTIVLNAHFGDRVHLAPAEFNFLMRFHAVIEERSGIGLPQAKMVHFNRPQKPWCSEQAVIAAMSDKRWGEACAMWLRGYAQCLQDMSLRERAASVGAQMRQG